MSIISSLGFKRLGLIASFIFLSVFLGFFALKFIQNKTCYLTIHSTDKKVDKVETFHCGLKSKGPDGKNQTYVGKLNKIWQNSNKVFANINFGLIQQDFPLGELELDNLYVIEQNKNNFSYINRVDNPVKTHLNKEGINEINEKYKGEYIQLSIRTSGSVNESLDLAKRIYAETQDNSLKKVASREIEYWQKCMPYLEKFLNSLSQDSFQGYLRHISSYSFDKYNQCLPQIYTVEVFL